MKIRYVGTPKQGNPALDDWRKYHSDMSRVAKAVAWMVGITGMGWVLFKTIPPTEEEIRRKLNRQGAVTEQTRQKNIDTINSLRRAAGIEADKMKKENNS